MRYDTIRLLERFSDQLFTFLPERLGIARIERIPAYSFADSTDGHVVRNNVADVAVLAVAAPSSSDGATTPAQTDVATP